MASERRVTRASAAAPASCSVSGNKPPDELKDAAPSPKFTELPNKCTEFATISLLQSMTCYRADNAEGVFFHLEEVNRSLLVDESNCVKAGTLRSLKKLGDLLPHCFHQSVPNSKVIRLDAHNNRTGGLFGTFVHLELLQTYLDDKLLLWTKTLQSGKLSVDQPQSMTLEEFHEWLATITSDSMLLEMSFQEIVNATSQQCHVEHGELSRVQQELKNACTVSMSTSTSSSSSSSSTSTVASKQLEVAASDMAFVFPWSKTDTDKQEKLFQMMIRLHENSVSQRDQLINDFSSTSDAAATALPSTSTSGAKVTTLIARSKKSSTPPTKA